jgi:protein-S-isoprenylcysteine O-methyltransferase Ste14
MITRFGNWIFHYRNFLFPLFYIMLFIPSPALFINLIIPIVLGSVIIISGILVRSATIGLVYIRRGGRKRKIDADNLVTEGIYSICRNPMYLGNLLLLLGFGIFANSVLFLVICFPLFSFIYYSIIKAEEEFLIGKFGDEYIEYKKNTYAIIPKLNLIRKQFSDYQFNFTRVVNREYNSLFIYFTGILLLLFFHKIIELNLLIILFTILLIIYLFVKFLKRRGVFGK